jgi:wyosine [tRNA(Phe)-imidazoG37] synthetase (radical SAM superfamily)
MKKTINDMIAFGPVPSRRLGRSLGINNIPPKACSYSCIYCQVGKTGRLQVERCSFYEPAEIVKRVEVKAKRAIEKGESIDYLTFVPDGEPTLDINLGREIDLLKPLGIKIGVITNGSMIFREDVRSDLMRADWVSVKIDSAWRTNWRKMNRPHKKLDLSSILEGMSEFSKSYRGEFVTETMLVAGINTGTEMLGDTAEFIAALRPARSYIAIPTRPPAENWAKPPLAEDVNTAFQIFSERIPQVEYLIGYEGNAFAYTGNFEKDILSVTSVHPMREDAVRHLITKAGEDWTAFTKLISKRKIVETDYNGQTYYVRNFNL